MSELLRRYRTVRGIKQAHLAELLRVSLARSIAAYYEARGLRPDGTVPAEALSANQLEPL